MSSFNPGTGDLSSTNLPSLLIEIAAKLQLAESVIIDNTPDNVTLTSDIDNQSFAINVTLPVTTSIDSTGQAVIVASDYVGVAGGTSALNNGGGDLKSTNLAAGLMEAAQLLHNAEKASGDPQPDNIQINYNLENGTADISAALPQTISLVNGKLTITATDYV